MSRPPRRPLAAQNPSGYGLKRAKLPLLLLALSPVLSFVAAAQQPRIRYEISCPNAARHEAEVRATFTGVAQPVLDVVMSRSSPGRHALHDFARNLYDVKATDG